MQIVKVATRKSPLALWQAAHVSERIKKLHPTVEVELVPMSTRGDKLLDAPLAKVGGKGLFIKELETALMDGRADIAVHSMKDVPVQLPPGMHIPVITERGDPRDVLVSATGACLQELPAGSRVGTSSLRRQCQLLALRSDLEMVNARGGVNTRLKKLDNGEFDALILANIGLVRLGLESLITENLEPERMLPSVGQGALGIECRIGDKAIERVISSLNDNDSAVRNRAERAMNQRLQGGCQAPVAGYADWCGKFLRLRGLVASMDGTEMLFEENKGSPDKPEDLGFQVADALLARGADRLLSQAYVE
mgnify:CR=1 FL=1